MGRTVKDLSRDLGSDELTEWLAFERLEPFGELQADFRAGQIAAAVVNVHVRNKSDMLMPSDFMPTLATAMGKSIGEPILLDDPVAQSDLIRRMVFGVETDERRRDS